MSRAVFVAVLLVTATAGSLRAARAIGWRRAALGRLVPPSPSPSVVPRLPARLPGRVEATLRAAGLEAGPTVARWALAGSVGVMAGALRWGPAGAGVAAAVAVGAPLVALAWHRGRQARRLSAVLPGLLESVAGSLRAGMSLPDALASAAAGTTGSALLDADLATVTASVGRGQPFADAVEAWAAARPQPGVRLVAAALVLGSEAGGARARAIDGVAATLRDRRALVAEVDALSSQARASAVVMMGAPVVFAALGLLSDPAVADFLFRTPAGLGCLLGGLGLDAAAGLWMLRIAGTATT